VVNFDLSTYKPPGIYTNPTQGPQLAVNSSLPRAVGIVGTAVGYKTFTETITFRDTDTSSPVNQNLTQAGIIKSTIVVTNISNGKPYDGASTGNTTNYLVNNIANGDNNDNSIYALQRNVTSTTIGQTETVRVSYNYQDSSYFLPYTFYDYRDVVAAYGPALTKYTDTNGVSSWEITSELSLAAKFAFLNGAYQVVCVAVKPASGTAPGTPAQDPDYGVAMQLLSDIPSIAIVTSCRSTNKDSTLPDVRAHVYQQSTSRYERRAILGFDGSTTVVPSSTRITAAQYTDSLDVSNRIMLVSPSAFTYYSSELAQTITLGGQYMAAALAGMTVAMSFAMPLTHKYPVGFTGIVAETPPLQDAQLTEESRSGLAVIEYDRRGNIRVRHGVTTDSTDLIPREWSITGQQDALVFRLRDYLDDANLIGQPIYSYTLVNVKASAEAALQSLVRDNLLVDYTGLTVRQLLSNPDVIEISFGWKPAFPLNYIVLTFAIDLTSGTVNTNTTTANINNATSTTQTSTSPTSTSTNDFGGSSNTLQSF